MISFVFATTLLAAGPTQTVPPAAWAPDARCAAALSVQAEKPDKARTIADGLPAPVTDPLPIEALIKMNRAASSARAEGLPRAVVEREVAALKIALRRYDADNPVKFRQMVTGCRVASVNRSGAAT